jgi:hypothetical protein
MTAPAEKGPLQDVWCVFLLLGATPVAVVGRTLAFGHHEDRSPIHGYEPTREATMAAFAKSWRRQ